LEECAVVNFIATAFGVGALCFVLGGVLGQEVCVRCSGGKPHGTRTLCERTIRWEDDIKMDHREIRWGGPGLILLRIGTGGGVF
jgi:hypothetical protein